MKTFYTVCILLGGVLGNLKHREVKMNTDQNKETVRRLYEDCLNKRNYALMKELVDDNFTGEGGAKGPDGFEHTIKPLVESFPDIQWKVDDLVGEGDEVVVRHSWIGTNKGAFRGLAASNKSIRNEGIAIFLFSGNKIVHAWVQTDRLGFLQQLGVVPVDLFPNAQKK
jgi:predicted ester cyclase